MHCSILSKGQAEWLGLEANHSIFLRVTLCYCGVILKVEIKFRTVSSSNCSSLSPSIRTPMFISLSQSVAMVQCERSVSINYVCIFLLCVIFSNFGLKRCFKEGHEFIKFSHGPKAKFFLGSKLMIHIYRNFYGICTLYGAKTISVWLLKIVKCLWKL